MRRASTSAIAQASACSRMRGAWLAATLGDQFFGIVEADDAPLGIQNDGCGNDRTKQGAAPLLHLGRRCATSPVCGRRVRNVYNKGES